MERDFGGDTENLTVPEMAGNFGGVTDNLENQREVNLESQRVTEEPGNIATQRELGVMTARSAEAELLNLGQNNEENHGVTGETLVFSGVNMETGVKNAPELKPLAADGSTEGKLGKAAVSLAHEDINLGIVKEAEKSSEEFKNDPSKLDDKRNELMVKMLRDEFGRIFADDGNEDDGIDQGGITGNYGGAEDRANQGGSKLA